MKYKLLVICGLETRKEDIEHSFHPLKQTKEAIELIDWIVSYEPKDQSDHFVHSNSPDYLSALYYYGKEKSVDVSFMFDGVKTSKLNTVFKQFNKSYDLLAKVTGND
jgi:hypothetical protein